MPRENNRRPLPIGSLVRTPTGRGAKVIGYYSDGRAELRYTEQEYGVQRDNVVALKPELLRRIEG